MVDPTKRPRGILTSSDRELLLGLVEYSNKQQYSNRRGDIRERVANALLDFSLLQYSLRDRDRKRIFQDTAGEAGVDEAQFPECIRSMLSWTYLGLKEQEYDFEALLTEAVEEAEAEYTQKYLNTNVDVSVNFNVDVTRTNDLSELISRIESGGPVHANRLYDLLQLSDGVPIDTADLSTIRVWFKSSYPMGEQAVIETLFKEYLGVDVDIVDAEARINPEELGIDKNDAVVDSSRPSPDPSKIKNKPSFGSSVSDEAVENVREKEMERRIRKDINDSVRDESPADNEVFDEIFSGVDRSSTTISSIIERNSMSDIEVTPDRVIELLRNIEEDIVSTTDIAAVFDCNLQTAKSVLSHTPKLDCQSVLDTNQNQLDLWIKSDSLSST